MRRPTKTSAFPFRPPGGKRDRSGILSSEDRARRKTAALFGFAFGARVRVHPLLPLLLLLAAHTGALARALYLASALLPHELGHLAAARATGTRVRRMELTPFGAAILMESGWSAPPARAALVALAGPMANALCLLAVATLAYAGALPGEAARPLLRANLLILSVNLLPVLPLDGGRAAGALLSARTGPLRAARIFAFGGYMLSALICLCAAYSGVVRGQWNIALFGAAAYLATCASREPEAARAATAEALVLRGEELSRLGRLAVRKIAVPESAAVSDALKHLRPGGIYTFVLYDQRMRPIGEVSESALLSAFPGGGETSLRDLIAGG